VSSASTPVGCLRRNVLHGSSSCCTAAFPVFLHVTCGASSGVAEHAARRVAWLPCNLAADSERSRARRPKKVNRRPGRTGFTAWPRGVTGRYAARMRILAAWILSLLAVLVAPPAAHAQLDPTWLEPVEPFQIADGLWYVGSRGISSFLLTGPEGHVLLDTGLAQNVPLVKASIEKAGFQPGDVKILLASHAHFDHVAGHAEMARLTGASVVALGEDARALASGTDLSALDGPDWTPVPVTRVIADGDVVELGPIRLTAHHTPGHTQGCTTWTTTVEDGGESRAVVLIGGTSVNPGVKLLTNARHPTIAQDYARTFEVLKKLPVQIFLAQHPAMFGMDEKRARLGSGANPFVDPEGYLRFVDGQEKAYRERLETERAERE
jgi:metallo-beta-lactamase class B